MKVLCLLLSLTITQVFAAEAQNIRLVINDGFNKEEIMLEGEVRGISVMEDVPVDAATGEKPTKKLMLREAINKDRVPAVEWIINTQYGTAQVRSNLTKIPNDDLATEFEIPAASVEAIRIYVSSIINRKHEIRLLFAPLEYEASFVPDEDILFNGVQFLAGKTTTTGYKFNSYRLSYIYHLNPDGKMRYRIGFTGKIRDAYTLVRQGGVETKYSNVGFVPLLHLGVNIILTDKISWDNEVEGSWAPQGYAIDFRSSINYQISKNFSINTGVGYLDGGAENDKVKTFSDVVFGFIGIKLKF